MIDNRVWSDYQQALFAFIESGTGSAVVQAVAGSGKTSSIEEACRRLPPGAEAAYFVFNKRNAVEAEARMPASVRVSTFHSACNRALAEHLNRPKIDGKKMFRIFKEEVDFGNITTREAADFGPAIQKLVGLAKNDGIGALIADEPSAWSRLVDHYGIDLDCDESEYEPGFDAQERVIEIARKLLQKSNTQVSSIDFDDMLYLAVKFSVPVPRYDIVFVDEAQDTNRVQRAILKMMLRPGGRLIAVGDSKQAIYGFRGADADAMELITEEFGCGSLPLSINYRCSKAVIREAQPYCRELLAFDGSPEGSVEMLDKWKLADFLPTDAILCRVTAPLITLAYKCLGANVRCKVLGREIGANLIALIKKMVGKNQNMSLETLDDKLDGWVAREVTRWMSKGEEEKAQAAQDRVDSIRAAISSLPEGEATIEQLMAHIDSLFTDDGTGSLTLSTIHKAKGLEWERVFILDRDRMPSKWARRPWQQVQEQNCIYIALTRARTDLRYLDMGVISE